MHCIEYYKIYYQYILYICKKFYRKINNLSHRLYLGLGEKESLQTQSNFE